MLLVDNKIVKIEHIDKLKSLREVDLSKNKIKSLESKCFPVSLTVLRFDENPFKQI